jgi:hypothetical protein
MPIEIKKVTLDNNEFSFDGKNVLCFNDGDVLRMPDDGCAVICSGVFNSAVQSLIQSIFASHDIDNIYLLFRNTASIKISELKKIQSAYMAYLGYINQFGNFFTSNMLQIDDTVQFENYTKLPFKYRDYIYRVIMDDIAELACRNYSGDVYDYYHNRHVEAAKEIVDELPCFLSFYKNTLVGYFSWKKKVALPGFMSFHLTDWIDIKLDKSLRSIIHAKNFIYSKELNNSLPFCAYTHLDNQRAIRFLEKNRFRLFTVRITISR